MTVALAAPPRAEVETIVVRAIAQVLRRPVAEIAVFNHLDELGLDSLGLIHASIVVERELGGRVAIEQAPPGGLHTVQDLVDLVSAAIEPAGEEAASC